MKSRLLLLFALGIFTMNAQTTHDLNWFTGIGSSVDLTIEVGDTVRWTWGDALPHTVENSPGNSVETFDSGTITGNGMTWSYTFTVVGDNDYLCGIHGAVSMSGTITVQDNLGLDDEVLSSFKLLKNPSSDVLEVKLPATAHSGSIILHDLQGKAVMNMEYNNESQLAIDISKFQSGLYLITIESENLKQTKQFIKQ